MGLDVFSMMGIFSFAASGATIAVEEKYKIQGVYVVGLVTSIGAGVISHLVTNIPVSALWENRLLAQLILIPITLIFFMRSPLSRFPRSFVLLDAMALSAFAIYGSVHAASFHLPMVDVMLAAVLTGAGGGVIRDLLVGRRPLVLDNKMYAAWPMLTGIIISMGWADNQVKLYVLFFMTVMFRMVSDLYGFPVGKWKREEETIKPN